MHAYVASGQDDVRHAAQEASGITFYPGTELMTDGMFSELLVMSLQHRGLSFCSRQRASKARRETDIGPSTK